MNVGSDSAGVGVLDNAVNSLTALIAQLSGAEACALYQPERGREGLVRRASYGAVPLFTELPYREIDRRLDKLNLITLPLHEDGLLTALLVLRFGRRGDPDYKELADLLPLLRSLLRLLNVGNAQLRTAARISDLEINLASQKITERVLGVLSEHPTPDKAAVGQVEEHVAKVLASCQFTQVLKEQLRELESNAAQRDLTGRAKRLLQQTLGLSEQEAYQKMRVLSRQRRRKISDIAAELLSAHDS